MMRGEDGRRLRMEGTEGTREDLLVLLEIQQNYMDVP